MTTTPPSLPKFDFTVPRGYRWLLARKLVGFAGGSALQPWHYLPAGQAFDLAARWPSGPSRTRLFAFAKRQDSDEIACFEVVDGVGRRIVRVQGWTGGPEGYAVLRSHAGFWDWLRSVIEDIAEWVELSPTD